MELDNKCDCIVVAKYFYQKKDETYAKVTFKKKKRKKKLVLPPPIMPGRDLIHNNGENISIFIEHAPCC